MEQIVKSLVKLRLKRKYHTGHKRRATEVLRAIESERGPTHPSVLRTCNEYATEVLGWRGYAPWLYAYAAMSGTFRQGWIPDNYYGQVVVPRLKGAYGEVSDLKSMTHLVLGSEYVPDIALCVNGVYMTPGGDIIAESEMASMLFAVGDRVVFKGDGSTQGRAVVVVHSDGFDAGSLSLLGNGVFQTYVIQHEMFTRFHDASVATLRMTTVTRQDGDVSLRATYLRLGTGTDTHVQSASHLRIPVDPRTGELRDVAYTSDWRSVHEHPDSAMSFRGVAIPSYDSCVDVVTHLHRRIPFVRCIGWDVAVDADGRAVVLEWNGAHNDIKFSEAVSGPCFADLGWEQLWK